MIAVKQAFPSAIVAALYDIDFLTFVFLGGTLDYKALLAAQRVDHE